MSSRGSKPPTGNLSYWSWACKGFIPGPETDAPPPALVISTDFYWKFAGEIEKMIKNKEQTQF